MNLKLNDKNLLTIAVVLVNFLLLVPGSWMISHLWNETQSFRAETESDIEQLKNDLSDLKMEIPQTYITKSAFNNYQIEQGEQYRYLDSKIK